MEKELVSFTFSVDGVKLQIIASAEAVAFRVGNGELLYISHETAQLLASAFNIAAGQEGSDV